MSDEDKQNVADTLETGAATFRKKTEDYGDSWRKIGEILLQLSDDDPVVLETKEDFVSFGLFTRRLDKFARAFHGEFVADGMNFESVTDAHEDEMVYAAMAAVNNNARDEHATSDGVVEQIRTAVGEPCVDPEPSTGTQDE